MRIAKRHQIRLTGVLLALAVLASRLPFVSRYLFEFDSIDFAIATFRFDLAQFTPHPPGYYLHILLGRWLTALTGDINSAFVWLAIMLSIGSVLFLWRAAAHLRGERVGMIAALLWLFAPMFWFYGEVATSYVHEAFFASALLYIGIRLLRAPGEQWLLYALAVTFSLTIAARQSSVLFFLPAVLVLLRYVRPAFSLLLRAGGVFVLLTLGWFTALVAESGGLSSYFTSLGNEHLYTTQSVLFGNSLSEHLGVFSKFVWLLFVGSLPVLLLVLYGVLVFPKASTRFIRESLKEQTARFVLLLAGPALVFYAGIYFMKAGYLLNVLPSIFLAGAVFLDQLAIFHARVVKERSKELLFTRRLITRYTGILVSVVVTFEVLWFTVPVGGNDFSQYANLFSHQTFRSSMESRYASQESKLSYAVNRAFAYSSLTGVRMIDSVHASVLRTIERESRDLRHAVILDTWWQRFTYFYFPHSTTYDIRSYEADTLFSCLRMYDYTLYPVKPVEVLPDSVEDVFILIREEHPDLRLLSQQVTLRKIDAPQHMDIYRIVDSTFSLAWKNVRFIKN